MSMRETHLESAEEFQANFQHLVDDLSAKIRALSSLRAISQGMTDQQTHMFAMELLEQAHDAFRRLYFEIWDHIPSVKEEMDLKMKNPDFFDCEEQMMGALAIHMDRLAESAGS